MAVHDIRSDLFPTVAFQAAVTTDTTTAGEIIDTADFENGFMAFVTTFSYTDGTYDFVVEEGLDSGLSDAAAVPSDKIIGTLAGLQLTAATSSGDNPPTIGVFSNKRYVRLNVVSTSTTTGSGINIDVIQRGENMPVV